MVACGYQPILDSKFIVIVTKMKDIEGHEK